MPKKITQNFPHLFITYVFLHKSVWFYSINLIFGEVAQHQSQCWFSLIKSLRYLTFSSVRAVFGRPLPGLRSVAEPRSSTLIINPFTDCFRWAKLPTLFWKFCNNCSVSKTKFLQCLDTSFIFVYDILPTTKVTGLTAMKTIIYRLLQFHLSGYVDVNIKIMTSQLVAQLL